MRRMLWITAAAALVFPATALRAQEQQQSQSQQSQSQSQAQSDSQQTQQQSSSASSQTQKSQDQKSQSQTAAQSAPPQDSLAAAARKAREQKKDAAKPAKVFTNDDLPSGGGISTVGAEKDADSAAAGSKEDAAPAGANDEKTWRSRFAKLHHKLDQDQDELDVLQRELGVAQTQFYGGDPTKAMNDQMSGQPFGTEYNKKLADIDAKKKQVEADKQAIADAEDELRKSGGDPGWAR
jgi:hypothetical protein